MNQNQCSLAHVKLPRTCGGRTIQRRVLSPDQVRGIAGRLQEPYASLALFLYVSGLRIGEAIAIQWSDFEDGVVKVQRRIYNGEVDTVKTSRSERGLPLPEDLIARLRTLSNQGWVFQASNGAPLNPRNALRRHVRPAAKALGLEIGGWHDFRHSLTTRLRRDGVHPKVISGVLGHSGVELAMTTYDHVEVEDLRDPLRQMLLSVTKSEPVA
jgi:integrase